ncbi:cytochrome P450 [Rhodococcus sp. NPDC059968]|uniref:cytochrome P450 n=1 Tax=Rhodococcus sp. NPDC059968 TaxID=3347017 RepID=UPI00366D1BC7
MGANNISTRKESDLPFLDVLSDEFERESLDVLREALTEGPVHRSRRGVEVLDYATVSELITDPRLDSQSASVYERMGGPKSLIEFADEGLLVAMNGDKHRRIRRVLSAGFRVRHVTERRHDMSAAAAALTDQWVNGRCDFVADFSSPFPMRVLCELLGIPSQDIWIFTAAATELHLLAAVPLAPHFPRIDAALRTLAEYVTELVATRKKRPERDVISSLIAVQDTEGKLTDAELAWSLVNLIFAGQDTTRYQLASAVLELVQHNAWDRLHDDPSLVPAAVDEALRMRPVTRFVVRIPREPIVIHDVRVEPGRRIILNLLSASHDPARFADPGRLRLDRAERYDLPFGWGMHHCLGAALARTEMEAALTLLTSRFTDVQIAEAPQMTAPAGMLHGPEKLSLTFQHR